MLDIKFVQSNYKLVKNSCISKGYDINFDLLFNLNIEKVNKEQKINELNHLKNKLSEKFYQFNSHTEELRNLRIEISRLDAQISIFNFEYEEIIKQLNDLLIKIPNILHYTVPIGLNSVDNLIVKEKKLNKTFDFDLKNHIELGTNLNILDFKRGTKVTSSGFLFFVDKGSILQRALINFFLDVAQENGYKQLSVPFMVNEESAKGTCQFPDKEDLMFRIDDEDLYPIPTAEIPITNFHRDETINNKYLPLKYSSYSPCFRKEAGSYGKETKGLNRLHQFDKVELVKITNQNSSYEELENLVKDVEKILELLELDYRIILMCSNETGFAQSKKYDFEVYSPGQKLWLEVSSCSNFETFQSKRLNLKYNDKGEKKLVHTINGSGLAIPRIFSSLIEQNQTKDGNILIPKCLQQYTKFDII